MQRTTGTSGSEFVRVCVGPDMAGVLLERIRENDFDLLYRLAGREAPSGRLTPEDLRREGMLHSGNLGAFNARAGGILADGNVLIDTTEGWVEMRFPSARHDRIRTGLDLIFSMLGRQESAFWLARRFRQEMAFPDAPEHSALVPPLSYYVGDNVRRLSRETGGAGIEAFERRVPPDLVVEVERSDASHDAAKVRDMCSRLGVAEIWTLDTQEKGWTLTMRDLQDPGGPKVLERSSVLPGVDAAVVLNALEPALDGYHREVVSVIEDYGAGMPAMEEVGFSP